MSTIPPSSDFMSRFHELWRKLQPLSPSERRAEIEKLTDQFLAALLFFASDEPPSFRGLQRGDQIGKCTLDKRLGSGGQGEVWLAQQDLAGQPRNVALKLIRPDLLRGKDAADRLARFRQEIGILMNLSGDGIAQLHDAGVDSLPGFDQEIPWFVMEYVPGRPLTDALRGRTVAEQVACFESVCQAVQQAHAPKGLLHLDLKPQNILVIEAGKLTPKVLDFGLARVFDPFRRLAVEQFGWGTLPYMAPEQLNPELGGADVRADVHALGVILFQVLTGQLPYDVAEGRSSGYIRAILQGPRLTLRQVHKHPPTGLTPAQWEALEAIVSRAMSLQRKERHPDPGDLAEALSKWLRQTGTSSKPVAGSMQQQGLEHTPQRRTEPGAGSQNSVLVIGGNVTGANVIVGHGNVIENNSPPGGRPGRSSRRKKRP